MNEQANPQRFLENQLIIAADREGRSISVATFREALSIISRFPDSVRAQLDYERVYRLKRINVSDLARRIASETPLKELEIEDVTRGVELARALIIASTRRTRRAPSARAELARREAIERFNEPSTLVVEVAHHAR